MFYEFSQNNSGGYFVNHPEKGIGHTVWVEADDACHANARAVIIGLYFDGCRTGVDCTCCGDRWHRQWGDEQGVKAPVPYERRYWYDEDGPRLVFVHKLSGEWSRL